jgi:hypothetical protein
MSEKKYYRVGLRQAVIYYYDVIIEADSQDHAEQNIDWNGWEDHMYRVGSRGDAPETTAVEPISADQIEDLKERYGDWCNVVGE